MTDIDEILIAKDKEKRRKALLKHAHSNYYDFESVAKELGEQYAQVAETVMKSWRKKKYGRRIKNVSDL